jgi:hypothetical protein
LLKPGATEPQTDSEEENSTIIEHLNWSSLDALPEVGRDLRRRHLHMIAAESHLATRPQK